MEKIRNNQSGFSAVVTALVLIIVAVISVVGFMVYKNRSDKTAKDSLTSSSKSETNAESKPAAKSDEYAGWRRYTNTEYGFSYRYPTVWTVSDESKLDSTQSASKQEFSTGLKLTENRKYNNTVVVEVLNQSLANASKYYDGYYAQSNLNQVSKTNGQLKGKDSVTYKVANSSQETRLYLFAVGTKTYSFGSINEDMNTQTDAKYWQLFDKVFNSLSIH